MIKVESFYTPIGKLTDEINTFLESKPTIKYLDVKIQKADHLFVMAWLVYEE